MISSESYGSKLEELDSGLKLQDEDRRRIRRWVVPTIAAVVALFVVAWIISQLRDTEDSAEIPAHDPHVDQPENNLSKSSSDQDVQKPPNGTDADYQGTAQTPAVAEQELVNLLSNDTVGASLLLRGFPFNFESGEVVYMTVVGDQINRFPTGPHSRAGPLWLSPDGNYVVTAEGAGRSNRGAWSWLIRDATVMVDLNQEVLWSVSHQRRTLSRVGLGMPGFFEQREIPSDVERIVGRLGSGFLVVRDLGLDGSEFAIWPDDGSTMAIKGIAGRDILDLGSSILLLHATNRRVVVMDVSRAGSVTLKASISVDFDVGRACLSPDETHIAALATATGGTQFTVIELDTGHELISEPLVDDFAWTADDDLVFTRRNSLLASDLESKPQRIAELSSDYSWQVASSSSAC